MEQSRQHVQLPNVILNEGEKNTLNPKDLLIYLIIKSYMNGYTKECFPSLKTISKKSGYSINTIRAAIKILEIEKYLYVQKRGKSQVYIFESCKSFEPFSYEFLFLDKLESAEKVYLIASQQHLRKDTKGYGKTTYSNQVMSEKINISARNIAKLDEGLIKKGFLNIVKTNKRDPVTGIFINEKIFHLDELGQSIIWTLQNHDEKIENLEELTTSTSKDIKILLRENKELKERLEKLERLNNTNNDEIIL